uniref:TetR/AcrR family transcriptional regulator n=2 Tax=unclassified Streptomyces TaxID=2593676 RepID=UPI001F0DA4A3|nr:TetR family transcriptional regulator [Streptomyces sp. S501]
MSKLDDHEVARACSASSLIPPVLVRLGPLDLGQVADLRPLLELVPDPLRAEGHEIRDEDIVRLSPLKHRNVTTGSRHVAERRLTPDPQKCVARIFACHAFSVSVNGMSGLRERKKEATRAALSWAAVRLTAERGWSAVKVEDIAAAVGVSPRTYNNYFSSKAEAIAFRHLERSLRLAAELRHGPPGEPLWEAITRAALRQLEPGPEVEHMPPQGPDEWAAGLRVMLAEPALEAEMLRAGKIAEKELAAAIADRAGMNLGTDLYPRLVAASVMAASNVALELFVQGGTGEPMEVLLPRALRMVAAGLPTP